MKRKTIEKIPPIMPDLPKRKKPGKIVKKTEKSDVKQQKSSKTGTKPNKTPEKIITAQLWDKYLILDIFSGRQTSAAGVWLRRHVTQIETGEYETYRPKESTWTEEKLKVAELGTNAIWYDHIDIKKYEIDMASKQLITAAVPGKYSWRYSSGQDGCLAGVMQLEDDYSQTKYEQKRESKWTRIHNLMEKVPQISGAMLKKIEQMLVGNLYYAFVDKTGKGHCTACGQDFDCDPKKMKHRQKALCPSCDKEVVVLKNKTQVEATEWLTIIQDVDEKQAVERHFKVELSWENKRGIELEEQIRLFMFRNDKRRAYKLYYYGNWSGWSEGNQSNRRWHTSYLWPDKKMIQDGVRGTDYENWMQVMPQLAAGGIKLNFNRLLVEVDLAFIGTVEYLFKGRFYRLLREISEGITYWGGWNGQSVNMRANTIEEVLNLKDRQRINRLRDKDGGACMLQWLQWSEMTGKKISDEALEFYHRADIMAKQYMESIVAIYMTPEKLMHYLQRQKKESYSAYKYSSVLNQYEDYLSMCQDLDKHMDDEMVYRPRELKRRHDEASEECRIRAEELQAKADKRAAARKAREMREKYPGYEELLQEIKNKYEFANDTYQIIVPENFAQITEEGMNLHHCVGNTERYFDRIVSRETYICFLRKCESPEESYYTIEVEPGGTIRQHRGMYDEEPEIEKVKPFLREWQKVIRKRMNAKDHELAKTSEILRQKNIDELKAKNNTRVLDGLMEDLMEVI